MSCTFESFEVQVQSGRPQTGGVASRTEILGQEAQLSKVSGMLRNIKSPNSKPL